MKKISKLGKYLIGGELILFLFVASPAYKTLLPLQAHIDIAIPLLAISLVPLARKAYLHRHSFIKENSAFLVWVILYGFFVIFIFISYYQTPTPIYGKEKLFDLTFRMGYFILAGYFILDSIISFKKFMKCWHLFGAIIAMTTIIKYFQYPADYRDILVVGGDYLSASVYLCVSCIYIYIKFIYQEKNNYQTYIKLAVYYIYIYILILLAARSPIMIYICVLAILSCGYTVCQKKANREVPIKRNFIMLGTTLLLIVTAFISGAADNLLFRYSVTFDDYSGNVSVVSEIDSLPEAGQESTIELVELPVDRKHDGYYLGSSQNEMRKMDYIEQTYLQYFASVKESSKYQLREDQIHFLELIDGSPIYTRDESEALHLPISYDQQLYTIAVKGNRLGRKELFLTSLQIISKGKFTGWGLGSYPALISNLDKTAYYPHIVFFEIIIESGWLAFVVYTLFLLYPFYRMIYAIYKDKKQINQPMLLAMLLCCIFIVLRSSLSSLAGMTMATLFLGASFRLNEFEDPFSKKLRVKLTRNKINE